MAEEYSGFLYAAYKDAITVEALAVDADLYSESIAFHAQQAAEKMLKKVFELHEEQPEFTHDIGRLLRVAIDKDWLTVSDDRARTIVSLTKFAVAARYETTPDITGGEALEAIAACNTLADLLDENGLPSVRINTKVSMLRDEGENMNRSDGSTRIIAEA